MILFSHVGFVVPDIEKSVEKWIGNGFYKMESEIIDDPGIGVRCCLLSRQGELDIELVSPLNNSLIPSPVQSRMRRGGGLDHIAYKIKSVQFKDFLKELNENRSEKIVFGPTFSILFQSTICFTMRTDGLLIEYIEAGEYDKEN